MDDNLIEIRKKISSLMNESKRRAKKNECLWCGKKITSLCNSHSVPQCVLKNIEVNGKFDYFNTLAELPVMNLDKGLNEAGTFKLLCRDCDSLLFKDYEDLNKLRVEPTGRMLAEIALKNLLVILNKRYIEIEMQKVLQETMEIPSYYNMKHQLHIKELDLKDFGWEYLRAKSIVQNGIDDDYKLLYWKRLDYVIPIAFQGLVVLYGDLEGNVVSDIYDFSEANIVKNLHICLFPLKNESVVFMFYHKDDHEYDVFAEQFNTLDDTQKLQLIGYILYERCEDMLFAKKFPHRTWIINKISELFVETPGVFFVSDKSEEEAYKRRDLLRLKNRDTSFPNILDSKFAFRTAESE